MKPRPIPGDYGRDYPPAYLAAAQRAEARIRYEISELSPEELLQRVREFYHVEEAAPVSPGLVQIYVDDYVNRVLDDTMWPHMLGGLNGLGMGAVSMIPDGDCFFHTILSDQAPESVRQRVTEVIGREPDVQAVRNHMADFLAAEFDRIQRDPSAAASSPATFLLVDEDNPSATHVDNIRQLGSFYNEASDLVPELFSYIFGVPLEVWQTRYRHQIGWSRDDPNAAPLVVVRRNLHFYAAGTAHGHPPTLNDPAVHPNRHDPPPADVPTASPETQSRGTRRVPVGPRRPNANRRGVNDPGRAGQDSSGGAGSKGAGGLRIDDPLVLGWPVGHDITLDIPERGSVWDQERRMPGDRRPWPDIDQVDQAKFPADAPVPHGKAPETVYTFERAFGSARGRTQASGSRSFSYTVTSAGRIVLPDGLELPADGWVRHGTDFLHTSQRVVLFGDSGWIGRVDNWDVLSRSLPMETLLPYRVRAESTAFFMTPVSGNGPSARIGWFAERPAAGRRNPSGTAAFLDLPRGAAGDGGPLRRPDQNEDVPVPVAALAAAESAITAVEEDYWQKSTHSRGTCVSVTVVVLGPDTGR